MKEYYIILGPKYNLREDFKHIYDSYFIFMNGGLRLTNCLIKKQAQVFNLGMKNF